MKFKSKQDFWRGVYSFKKSALRFRFGAYKWWEEKVVPPMKKYDGESYFSHNLNPNGAALNKMQSRAEKLVIKTKKNIHAINSKAFKGNSVVMGLTLDWGRKNTWYERPPVYNIGGFGAIGAFQRDPSRAGSYHIKTFIGGEGVASDAIPIKVDGTDIAKPILVKVLASQNHRDLSSTAKKRRDITKRFPDAKELIECWEMSNDGYRFFPTLTVSQISDSPNLLKGRVMRTFYLRRSAKALGRHFVFNNDTAQLDATWHVAKARIIISTGPIELTLHVAAFPERDAVEGFTSLTGESNPYVADAMSTRFGDFGREDPLPKGGVYFNNGSGMGFGAGM